MNSILAKTLSTLRSNGPEILTGLGVGGVFATSYFANKAGYEAAQHFSEGPPIEEIAVKERIKQTWKLYIPPVVSGAFTVGCILTGARGSNKRTAAAVSAYSLVDRAFSEYKEKVVEQIGKNKELKIRDEIAQDKVTADFENCDKSVVIFGSGNVLCCELMTRRYLRSDMETLKKAANEINFRINHDIYVTLDEFYDLIGLPHTSVSSNLGWDSLKLLDLSFTTTLAEDGEPCLAFEYNYTKPLR